MRLYAVGVLVLAATGFAGAQSGAKWDYNGKTGPLVWSRLDPAYQACAKGHQQSPIDIRGAHLNKALQPIEFHYMASSLELENTGGTIVAHVKPGSYILVDGTRYDLQQFEFHHPSESAVSGKLTDMNVELLHKNADGKMAIVGATEKVSDMVNPGGFLPADRGYWTYTGSLPEPPCTEGVRWFVFENEISLSLEQLKAFSYLFRVNSRPLQDTHGRRIEANE
jgi:carbonic anhydrase